jgi:mono/diheme cytochrome c family protein
MPSHWLAPDLTQPTQSVLAYSSVQDAAQWLRTGVSDNAVATGPMATYVREVSQFLTPDDAQAVVIYLQSNMTLKAEQEGLASEAQHKMPNQETLTAGAAVYEQHCANCHGEQGQGQAGRYPALAHNAALNQVLADNLIQTTLFGGFGPSTQDNPRPWGMPPFIFTLQNEQVAQALSYVRQAWGNQAPMVNALDVDKLRGLAR